MAKEKKKGKGIGFGSAEDILGGVATSLSGFATVTEGETANEIAEMNAATDRRKAATVLVESKRRARLELDKGDSVVSSVTANAAARGISQEGSATAIKARTLLVSNLNAIEQRRVAFAEANRLESSANLSELRGDIARRNARTAGYAQIGQGISSMFAKK